MGSPEDSIVPEESPESSMSPEESPESSMSPAPAFDSTSVVGKIIPKRSSITPLMRSKKMGCGRPSVVATKVRTWRRISVRIGKSLKEQTCI